MAILQDDPTTGLDSVLDESQSNWALTLTQRDRIDAVAHAALFGELVEMWERVKAGWEYEYERRVRLRVFVGVSEWEPRWFGEFRAELLGDEALHRCYYSVWTEYAQDYELLKLV